MKLYEKIDKMHPLRSAKWIWPEGLTYIYNTFAAFRKDFEVTQEFNNAKIYITADQAYKLYINGKYVCRGPARGYQNHWPFDELNVSDYLQVGQNWISVQAYNPGIGTFQYRHESSAGLICALGIDEEQIIVSDESWNKRRMNEFKSDTDRYSLQLNFQEHLDTLNLDNNWIFAENPKINWQVSDTEDCTWNDILPYGCSPYDTLEKRGIPMLHEEFVTFDKIVCTSSGKCEEGYRSRKNVSWGWVKEALDTEKWNTIDRPDVIDEDSFKKITLPVSGENHYNSFTIDVGEYLVGSLNLEISGAEGSEIIDFQYHENMVGCRPAIRPAGKEMCSIALADRLFLSDKTIKHEFFHLQGFRYLTIIVRNSFKPIDIKLKIKKTQYPFTMKGDFECADKNINDIFDICRRTQQICSLDAYVDTPWREQAQWWGDARVQAHNTFYLDGDPKLLIRGIRSIAGQSTLQGLTYGHAPTIAYNCILPDFSLTWIMTFWDYYWQTGKIDLFFEFLPRIKEILNYFDSEDAKSESGLIMYDERYWYFGDWADIYRAGIPTFLNIWYLYTLQHLERLLKIADMEEEANTISKKAEIHSKLIIKYLYDKEKCEFYGGLDVNMNMVNQQSVHDHMIAVLTGLVPEKNELFYNKWILPYLKMEKQSVATPSVFWSSYVLEEAGKKGYSKEVINFIKTKWTPMLETGTTWEQFTWNEKENGTASHAWAAHPSYHFTNIVTGIRQLEAGWKKISFSPDFNLDINKAVSKIPSPLGLIEASWEIKNNKYYAEINIPDGVICQIEINGNKEINNKAGLYKFSGEIALDR